MHWDSGVDEGERAGVDAGCEEGTVLREDVDGEGDGGVGVEFGEEVLGEGAADCGLHFCYTSVFTR